MTPDRDRDDDGRAHNARPRDRLGRPLARGAVGITHAERGNPTGARRLIERGRAAIAPFVDSAPRGIDVPGLCARADAALPTLADDAILPVTLPTPRLVRMDS